MLSHWADTNGFTFSSRKQCVCISADFRSSHPNPELTLNGTLIPVVKQTKFLGIIFDNKAQIPLGSTRLDTFDFVEQVETSVSSETSRAVPTWRTTNKLVQV